MRCFLQMLGHQIRQVFASGNVSQIYMASSGLVTHVAVANVNVSGPLVIQRILRQVNTSFIIIEQAYPTLRLHQKWIGLKDIQLKDSN